MPDHSASVEASTSCAIELVGGGGQMAQTPADGASLNSDCLRHPQVKAAQLQSDRIADRVLTRRDGRLSFTLCFNRQPARHIDLSQIRARGHASG